MPYILSDLRRGTRSSITNTCPLSQLGMMMAPESEFLVASLVCAGKLPPSDWLSGPGPAPVYRDHEAALKVLASIKNQLSLLDYAAASGPEYVIRLLRRYQSAERCSYSDSFSPEAPEELTGRYDDAFAVDAIEDLESTLPEQGKITWGVACLYSGIGLQYLMGKKPGLPDNTWEEVPGEQTWRTNVFTEAVEKGKTVSRLGDLYAFPIQLDAAILSDSLAEDPSALS